MRQVARESLPVLLAAIFLFPSCKRERAAAPPVPQPVHTEAEADKGVQTAIDQGLPPPNEEFSDAGASGAPKVSKDQLWTCYQEIYCAQKRGEMEKIPDIYRKCGFENPQDFATAWIEAAKDTEWVSRLAHEVSKACK